MKRTAIALALALAASPATAYKIGTPLTISDYRWTASGSFLPAPDCSNLILDFTGDFANSK
jgi:hypothetical protein